MRDVIIYKKTENSEGLKVCNISTAAGCLAAQDLVSWIIESLVGEDMVHKVLESVQPVGEALQIER
ncbi:hypothetical protein AZF08_08420 [Bacillus gaemokensis]|nr:hypothetical protein [Bacillus gaemokensis]KYG37418.1 hypothetical protein AZF08_08420 [Bacillus gaemokensis]